MDFFSSNLIFKNMPKVCFKTHKADSIRHIKVWWVIRDLQLNWLKAQLDLFKGWPIYFTNFLGDLCHF